MLDQKNLFISTSNPRKLAEFKRFGLSVEARMGEDLPEVQGTPEEVIIYKALAAGENVLVEDTSLDIEGFDAGVNIRWVMESVKKTAALNGSLTVPALWRVLIAVQQNGVLYVAKAEVPGVVTGEPRGTGFGFDTYFIPDGYTQTLGELEELGQKDGISARRSALLNLMNGACLMTAVSSIREWTGSYQGEPGSPVAGV
jgi:inosine/xanthosine triphosphate pyrophosphatase family protein